VFRNIDENDFNLGVVWVISDGCWRKKNDLNLVVVRVALLRLVFSPDCSKCFGILIFLGTKCLGILIFFSNLFILRIVTCHCV
jgi:hypothetical protein